MADGAALVGTLRELAPGFPDDVYERVAAEAKAAVGDEAAAGVLNNEALDRMMAIPRPPSPPPPPEPTRRQTRTQVLEMFPWVEPKWVLSQCRKGKSLEEMIELLTDPATQAPRKAAKRRSGPEEPLRVKEEPDAETDLFKRRLRSRIGEKQYLAAAQFALADAFPWVSTLTIRRILSAFGGNFAPTYQALFVECNSPAFQQTLAVKTLRGTAIPTSLPLGPPPNAGYVWLEKHPPVKQLQLTTARRRPKRKAVPRSLAAELAWVEEALGPQPFNQADDAVAKAEAMDCDVCCAPQPMAAFRACREAHLFCKTCLESQAQEAVYGRGSGEVGCLESGCKAGYSAEVLSELLTTDEVARLEERRTAASVAAAGLEGFVACRYCPWGAVLPGAETDKVFRCGGCEAEYCRLCERDWGLEHLGRRCAELEEDEEGAKRRRLEEALSQAVLRLCHKCGLQFQKDEGCNRMTCTCGATSCYLCREKNISYKHFCGHLREPGHGCSVCTKCSLWENPEHVDKQRLQEAQARVAAEQHTQAPQPATA